MIRKEWLLGLCLLGSPALAEIKLSGFATIGGGVVLKGEDRDGTGNTFLADYPNVALYDEDLSFKPDTKLGLQIASDLTDGLRITSQVVGRGANDFNADVEWLYLSYALTPALTLQAGRKRLPLYYYSDFFDVGYAYPWVRPPVDNYTWHMNNYNGVNLVYKGELAGVGVNTNLYLGRESDSHNKLLSDWFFGAKTEEHWKNIVGVVVSFMQGPFDVRLNYMQSDADRTRTDDPDKSFEDVRIRFTGLSVNYTRQNLSLLTELNRFKRNDDTTRGGYSTKDLIDTYLVTLTYRIGDWTPYISHSSFDEENKEEIHTTSSVGMRYDFHHSAALKVQYDRFKDKGEYAVTGSGDADLLSVSVDLVF